MIKITYRSETMRYAFDHRKTSELVVPATPWHAPNVDVWRLQAKAGHGLIECANASWAGLRR